MLFNRTGRLTMNQLLAAGRIVGLAIAIVLASSVALVKHNRSVNLRNDLVVALSDASERDAQLSALRRIRARDQTLCYAVASRIVSSEHFEQAVREFCLDVLMSRDAVDGTSIDALASRPWFRAEWLQFEASNVGPLAGASAGPIYLRLLPDFGENPSIAFYLSLSSTTRVEWGDWLDRRHRGEPAELNVVVTRYSAEREVVGFGRVRPVKRAAKRERKRT